MNNNTFSFSDLLNESSGTIDNMNITNLTVDTLVGNTATLNEASINFLNGATASINNLTGITATFDDITINNLSSSNFIGSSGGKIIPYGLTGTNNQVYINYGVSGATLSLPQDIDINSTPSFNGINLSNNITQNVVGEKGFVIGNIANDTPFGYAGICHQSLANSFANCCLVQNNGGDTTYNALAGKILVFAQGGMHRLRVWNNQPPYGYNSQVEVVSDDDYVSSSNSALRVNGGIYCGKKLFVGDTILTDDIESNSNTLNIGSSSNTSTLNLACSTGVQIVNIGIGNLNAQTNINIGGINDIVSIGGTLTYVNSTNLDITNNQIYINSNGTTLSARGSGLIISTSGNTYSGWIREDTLTGKQFLFKPVESTYQLNTPTLTADSEIITSTENQTITALKTFSAGLSGTTGYFQGISATNITTNNILTNQIYGTTGYFQGISASNIFSNDILTNQIYGTTMIFGTGGGNTLSIQSAILGGATSSKLLRVDANKNILSSLYDETDLVRINDNQTITGQKIFTGGISGSTLMIGGLTGTTISSPTFNVIGATINKYAFIDANRNIVSVNDPSTNLLSTSNIWTNTNQFNSSVKFTSLPSFTNPTSLLGLSINDVCVVDAFSTVKLDGITANNITVSSTTANKLLLTNTNKQLTSSTYGISDIVLTSTNQNINGVKTFLDGITSNNITVSTATANKLLLTDTNKQLTSSIYGISDLVLTTTNQVVGGNKTFTNDISIGGDLTIQNSSNWSRANLVAGNATNNRALLYLQSFGSAGQALSMFADAGTFNLFNNNTSRTIWSCPKTTDVMNFEQGAFIKGVSDASNASAGYVGQYLETIMTNIVPTTTLVRINAGSLALTAGDWDCDLCAVFEVQNNKTNAIEIGISNNATATNFTDRVFGQNCVLRQSTSPISDVGFSMNVNAYRVNISTSTTYYIKLLMDWSGNLSSAQIPKINSARFSARRVR